MKEKSVVSRTQNLKVKYFVYEGGPWKDDRNKLFHYSQRQPRMFRTNFILSPRECGVIILSDPEESSNATPGKQENGDSRISLARRLCHEIYNIEGVIEVSVHADFLIVSLYIPEDWAEIQPQVEEVIASFYPGVTFINGIPD